MPSPSGLVDAILGALSAQDPVLFAGAGLGCRVGLPDWSDYLLGLGQAAQDHGDPDAANFIRARVRAERYVEAAAVFKQAEIPEGERWRAITTPLDRRLKDSELEKLSALVSLPFGAIVSTSFDHAPHQALTHNSRWHKCFERGDGSLRGAAFCKDFFVARVHGRVEQPLTMALDTADYVNLANDTFYLDFLIEILKNRTCLFLGFSFLDPAITQVLRLYEERCGPTYHRSHVALIPAGSLELERRLKSVGIKPATYSPANRHGELWRAIRTASDRVAAATPTQSHAVSPVFRAAPVHRFMAFAYAQMEASRERGPIVEIVQDGIVASLLPATSEALIDGIRPILGVTPGEAEALVKTSLRRLLANETTRRQGDVFERASDSLSPLDSKLQELAQHAVDRVRVRTQLPVSSHDVDTARGVLERVFLSRAWDLAAHYAGASSGWGRDVHRVVSATMREVPQQSSHPDAIASALVDLLSSPEDRETTLLVDIGRAAFALQLVLSTPRSTLFQRHALPEVVYLDANVLLPAITPGHPLEAGYTSLLRQLDRAARAAGIDFGVRVGLQFLNEVVSHRALAERLVHNARLEDPERLHRHALFYGLTDTNVFVAAYATQARARPLPFREFLQTFAPYHNEAQLAAFLASKGIEAVEMFEQDDNRFSALLSALKSGYADHRRRGEREKETILINHEAQQLCALTRDCEDSRSTLFLTADTRLRSIISSDDQLRSLLGSVVSQAGLMALVDVMVGLEADTRSLSRIMWATSAGSDQDALFDYFIRLGLRKYEEGMGMEMQEAARAIAAEAVAEGERDRVPLFGGDSDSAAESASFLDRYTDRFFEYWRDAVEKREREAQLDREPT